MWDAGELFSIGLPEQAQILSLLVVNGKLSEKWLEANAGKNEQELQYRLLSN